MADHSHTSDNSRNSDPLASCIAQMLAEVPPDSRNSIPRGNIETLGKSLWEWFESTKTAAVRIRPAEGVRNELLGHHLLEAVGPDRPFLVDSLLGACSDLGFEVMTLFHPIVETADGRFSLIQIHLPDLSEGEQARLLAEAQATLSDVHAATADYQEIQKLKKLSGHVHVFETIFLKNDDFLKLFFEE